MASSGSCYLLYIYTKESEENNKAAPERFVDDLKAVMDAAECTGFAAPEIIKAAAATDAAPLQPPKMATKGRRSDPRRFFHNQIHKSSFCQLSSLDQIWAHQKI